MSYVLCCIEDAIRRPGPSDAVSWPIDSDSDDDASLMRAADAAEQPAVESPIAATVTRAVESSNAATVTRATTSADPAAAASGSGDGRPVPDVATGSGAGVSTAADADKFCRDLAKLISSNRCLGFGVELPVANASATGTATASAKGPAPKKSHHKKVTKEGTTKDAATSPDASGAAKRKRGRPAKLAVQLPRIFQLDHERGRTDFDRNGCDSDDVICNGSVDSGHGSAVARPLTIVHDENAVADPSSVGHFYGQL